MKIRKENKGVTRTIYSLKGVQIKNQGKNIYSEDGSSFVKQWIGNPTQYFKYNKLKGEKELVNLKPIARSNVIKKRGLKLFRNNPNIGVIDLETY